MGYSSLFAYLTEYLDYSAASSQRRIDAARLLIELPEVSEMIETGKINLSQVSMVQQSAREAKRIHKHRVEAKVKKEILLQIQSKSKAESQALVSKAFELPVFDAPVTKHQSDESVRVEMTFTKQQWQKIQLMRQILSNSVNSSDLSAVMVHLAEKVIQKKFGKPQIPTSAAEVGHSKNSLSRKYISIKLKREVFLKYPFCQYRDPQTGKVCGQKHYLQLEHKKPIWAGGTDDPQNLTVLCANHNRYQYKKQSGIQSVINP